MTSGAHHGLPDLQLELEQDRTAEIVERGELSALRVRRARLEVVSGPDRGRAIELHHLALVAGTSSRCDLTLTDPAVSSRHLEVLPTERGYLVRDLGSKNGTFIGRLRIGEALLARGEEIGIGHSALRLVLLDEHEELPLSRETSFGTLLGRSAAMRQVFTVLERAAATDATLLIEGETGTGKELAARNVHLLSRRSVGPLCVVDCGAVAPALVESELFGHAKGAFTGATSARPGIFEQAEGGTVLVDEVDELDPALQPRLLRVLESRETRRVGENSYRRVDVRIIANSKRSLASAVERGAFREDLFFRLSVLQLRLPPLRHRREDIPLIARALVAKLDPGADVEQVVGRQVQALFVNHDWPGNVRELRNVIERLLVFPDRPALALQSSAALDQEEPTPLNLLDMEFRAAQARNNERFERAYLTLLLDECDGVVAAAARRAGLPRPTFYRLMKKHQLRR